MKKQKQAIYEGWAIVNRPSNEFFVLFRADKRDAENILEKIVSIRGKFELIKVKVEEVKINYDK